jgi:hypothetical protein
MKTASQSVEQFSLLRVHIPSLDCVRAPGDREIVEAADDWSAKAFLSRCSAMLQ